MALSRYELFDLEADPFELDNIYDSVNTTLKEKLHRLVREWYDCQGETCL